MIFKLLPSFPVSSLCAPSVIASSSRHDQVSVAKENPKRKWKGEGDISNDATRRKSAHSVAFVPSRRFDQARCMWGSCPNQHFLLVNVTPVLGAIAKPYPLLSRDGGHGLDHRNHEPDLEILPLASHSNSLPSHTPTVPLTHANLSLRPCFQPLTEQEAANNSLRKGYLHPTTEYFRMTANSPTTLTLTLTRQDKTR